MYLDLDLLADLVALERCRSFSGAAARLNLTVSALSRRIDRLERQLGARLIDRGPGGTGGLTPAGERIVARAGPILRSAAELHRLALDPAVRLLRLGVPGVPSDHDRAWRWTILKRMFADAVPGVRLKVCGVPFAACTTALVDGKVDVMLSQVEPERAGTTARLITTAGRILVVPQVHRLAGLASVSVADLAAERLVVESRATDAWFSPWLLGDLEPHRPDRLLRIEVSSFGAAAALLRDHRCATVTTAMAATAVPPGMSYAAVADAPQLQVRADHRTGDRQPGLGELITMLRLFAAVPDHRLPGSAAGAEASPG